MQLIMWCGGGVCAFVCVCVHTDTRERECVCVDALSACTQLATLCVMLID